jgi:hypothetical protein
MRAPSPAIPPDFVTAAERSGVHAPDNGASIIGTERLNLSQNDPARNNIPFFDMLIKDKVSSRPFGSALG